MVVMAADDNIGARVVQQLLERSQFRIVHRLSTKQGAARFCNIHDERELYSAGHRRVSRQYTWYWHAFGINPLRLRGERGKSSREKVRMTSSNCEQLFVLNRAESMVYSVPKMTIKTKSIMRRRVNRAGPSGLV